MDKTTLVRLENEVPMYLRSVLDACVSYTETLEDGKVVFDLVITPDDILHVSFESNQDAYETARRHLSDLCALTPEQRKDLP
jgi:hypothetical protein